MREQGHYWVKFADNWIVGYWWGEKWWIPGRSDPFTDAWFQTITETPIVCGESA